MSRHGLDQPKMQGFNPDAKQAVGLLGALVACMTITITWATRYAHGSDLLNRRAVGGFILIFLYAAFGRHPVMLLYLAAFFFGVILQRLCTATLRANGWEIHSFSVGTPFFTCTLGERWGQDIETLSIFLAFLFVGCAAQTNPWLYPLAGWLMFGWGAVVIDTAITKGIQRRRAQHLIDAQIENENLMAAYRERRR